MNKKKQNIMKLSETSQYPGILYIRCQVSLFSSSRWWKEQRINRWLIFIFISLANETISLCYGPRFGPMTVSVSRQNKIIIIYLYLIVWPNGDGASSSYLTWPPVRSKWICCLQLLGALGTVLCLILSIYMFDSLMMNVRKNHQL